MEQNVALEVRFQGETQIYSPSFRTTWQDLRAMLKCSFDVDDIAVYYVDDEDDEVAVDSQEEYNEAKKIAAKCHNVLRLRVYPQEQPMEVDTPAAAVSNQSKSSPDAVKRKRVHTASIPEVIIPDSTSNTPPSTQPIPIPPPRPTVSPRLSRARSLPSHKQATVTGCVQKAVEELKQMNTSTAELEASPAKEKALIDHIVKGVLDGLETSICEKNRPHSWDPSQDTRVPLFSTPQASGLGTTPKGRSPGHGPILEHTGITCNNCDTVISGTRFKCGHCLDYDLCEDCEALPRVHDPNHVFLKLKRPAFRVGMKSDGRVAPIFKHPIYSDDDTPVWEYKIKKLEEKMARKAARAELKRKYREEKRRAKMECHGQVSPTKREKIEKMAEEQAEQIMAAASFAVTPTSAVTTTSSAASVETVPLLVRKFDASFVRDGNLPDETHMQPKTKFVKSWIMKNSGNVQWNHDTKLKYLWGDIKLLSSDPMEIPPLASGEEGPVCVDFEAPVKPGHYQSHWRLTQKGEQFGHRVWCSIIVDKAEVLEPTCEKKKTVQEEIILPKVQETAPIPFDLGENTASSAVAHLQTDQADTVDLSRVVSSSDVLTAQDVLSFELLSIRDDQDADKEVEGVNSPAATTTPNNTPIVGLTPCISPIPQLDEKLLCRRVSEHSDLEIVRREDIPEIVETPDMMARDGPVSEDAHEGVEIGAVYSDNEDGVESICSSSDSDMLDDYYVVPLPDCFDPSKPIDKSMILSKTSLTSSMTSSVTIQSSSEDSSLIRLPSYEESQAELDRFEDDRAESERLSPPPATEQGAEGITKETPVINKETPVIITAEDKEEAKQDTTKEEIVDLAQDETEAQPTLEGATADDDSLTVDALLSTPSNTVLQTVPLIPLVAATPLQQLSSTPSPKSTSPTPQTVAMTPMPEITLLATPAEAPTILDGGVLINPEGNVSYHVTSHPEVVQETQTSAEGASDGTNIDDTPSQSPETAEPEPEREPERQEEHDDEFHDAQDAPSVPQQTPYNDVQFHAQTDPVDLLGYTAARAVEVAGSVVRQAFDTAANSMGALLRPQPIPMPAPYQPPPPPPDNQRPSPSPMDQLIEMGFGNRARNQSLLEKHNEDVSRCVQDLLHEEDNDWHNNRH